MNFLDYIYLIRRNLVSVALITLLVMGVTMTLVKMKNNNAFQSTAFITVGNSLKTFGTLSPYENVQAADHFSETVQGWFKNPDFQQRIQKTAKTDISARKQEKQNVVISFSADSEETSKKINEDIKSELEKEIDSYNLKTGSTFQLAAYSLNIEEKPLSYLIFMIVSLLGGITLSSFAVYFLEYFTRKTSSISQIQAVTGKPPIDIIHGLNKNDLTFIRAIVKKNEKKNVQFITMSGGSKKAHDLFQQKIGGNNVHIVNFPEHAEKISENAHHVVVCELGRTTTDDLGKIMALLNPTFDIIIVVS